MQIKVDWHLRFSGQILKLNAIFSSTELGYMEIGNFFVRFQFEKILQTF